MVQWLALSRRSKKPMSRFPPDTQVFYHGQKMYTLGQLARLNWQFECETCGTLASYPESQLGTGNIYHGWMVKGISFSTIT